MARKKQVRDVHFYFGQHLETSRYLPAGYRPGTGTHIVETADPLPANRKSYDELMKMVYGPFRATTYNLTRSQFLEDALKRGGGIGVGEFLLTKSEKRRARTLKARLKKSMKELERPSTPRQAASRTRRFIQDHSKFHFSFRHSLLVKAVRRANKPVTGRYGTGHSLFSRDLRRAGIRSSRQTEPILFSWPLVVSRNIYLGRRPSYANCLRSYVSVWKSFYAVLSPEPPSRLTPKKDLLIDALKYELLKRLGRNQLETIVRERNPGKILEYNSLPRNASQRRLKQWLDQNSVFWRRLAGKR